MKLTAALFIHLSSFTFGFGQAELIIDDTPPFALGGPTTRLLKVKGAEAAPQKRFLKGGKNKKKNKEPCDPEDVVLADFPQWGAERGYWLGEYSFYSADGTPNENPEWPHPYDNYKGFITGNVEGNAYRQRNVFLYPPLSGDKCSQYEPSVHPRSNGTCGVNGNSLVFFADQSATTCSDNEELGGDVNGPFLSPFGPLDTTTELVGADNALLYQVYVPSFTTPFQSQLTTLTKSAGSEQFDIRTRTAQGFDLFVNPGSQSYSSFYRERKVSKEDFYVALNATIVEYNILSSDLCYLDGGAGRQPVANYTSGYDQCVAHLETSFDL